MGRRFAAGPFGTSKASCKTFRYGTQKVKTALEGICYRSYLERGTLPQDQSELEEAKEDKKRPITKLVKINAQTGKLYSDEDHANGKSFFMKISVVGYEEIGQSRKVESVQKKAPSTKIRSWIGLLRETLKTCKDCESIHRRYFLSKNALSACCQEFWELGGGE